MFVMKKIIIILTALMLALSFAGTTVFGAGKKIVVMPFYDDSGYRGPWKLYLGIPEMLGDMLLDEYFEVVPKDTLSAFLPTQAKKNIFVKFINIFRDPKPNAKVMSDQEVISIARKLNTDYAVTGIIDDYTYRRDGVGDVMLGGYKGYSAKVKVSNVRVIRVSDGSTVGTFKGESEQKERGLGLDLFGKPRKRDLEFYSLDSLEFGSKRFISSLMGTTTVEALNKVQKDIRAVITLPDTNWYSQKKFRIVSMEEGSVSINAGTLDGIKPGDKFRVFASDSGVLVGKVNVTNLWSDHIARVEILEGKDAIRSGDVIMPDR
jgi:hypothetical protein